MGFKKIDNPWLVRVLFTLLPVFGAIVGAALSPLLADTISPDTSGGSIDIYAVSHPDLYKHGAVYGFIFGFVLAAGIIIQLARQAGQAEKAGDTEAHAH